MDLRAHVRPWSGGAFRHIPDGSPYGPLDFRFAGMGRDNRWNDQGAPTLYLAGDRAVALAEFARHFEERPPRARPTVARALYRLEVSVERVVDLRDPGVLDSISLTSVEQFLDPELARATARYVRELVDAQALLVPSIAFLDDLRRWNLVVHLDRVDAARAISGVRRVATFTVAQALAR